MAAGDITIKHGTPVTITITLAGLASSSTFLAGRESTAVVKSDPELDHTLTGKVTTGTSPTAGKQINVYVYGQHDDTPTYPDVLDGTDSDETLTSENVRNSMLAGPVPIAVDSTSDRTYWIRPTSIGALFGGVLPKRWGLFVAHDTVAALNATGSNHEFKYTPVYEQMAQS